MGVFEFISHERFPDDDFTKEAVVLCFEKKYRVTYVRKKMQNGGLFWDVIATAVKVGSDKKYLKSFSQDSNFLKDDILHFLNGRGWEKGGQSVKQSDELPF
jgi:hypothetical protein